MSSIIWVAADGSWGDSAVSIFDTSRWTQSDFDRLDEADDDDRLKVAQAIQAKRGV